MIYYEEEGKTLQKKRGLGDVDAAYKKRGGVKKESKKD